jgi:hypothetical protein
VAIGNPVIVRKPSITVEYPADGGAGEATTIDLGCAVRTLSFDENSSSNPVPTFCNPAGTVQGATTREATVSVYWTDELVTELTPHLNDEGTFRVVYNTGDTKQTEFKGTIASIPFGTITPDQPIEADLVISINGDITRTTVTAP